MPACEKIVVVTKKTALEELVERFNTRDQARFYIEHMGTPFAGYQDAHDAYHRALERLKDAIPAGIRSQFVERSFLPNFTFGESDLVATLGPDGLVVNTAKYLSGQPLLALNPDPARMDGVLIPFSVERAAGALQRAVEGDVVVKLISMAKTELNDGQALYAVNDLFVGQRTHVSARYRLQYRGQAENQSSSGIIVSTGAGSTGWFRSVLTGATEIAGAYRQEKEDPPDSHDYRFDWEADTLYFSVREPFLSRVSSAALVFGPIAGDERLEIVSQMPQNGVIFSDGVESDYLQFDSGAIARIGLAEKKLSLIVEA